MTQRQRLLRVFVGDTANHRTDEKCMIDELGEVNLPDWILVEEKKYCTK
jgi:hypothetical protein